MSAAAPTLPPLRTVIERFDLRPRRTLGQHFLLDQNLTDRIARAAGALSCTNVIEVGPGPGGLTRSLLAAGAKRVVAIEKDRRCVAALEELAAAHSDRLAIVEADALAVDPAALVPPPRRIVANLPYNISTVLLISWLRQARAYAGFTLMFQREVAARLAAAPGTAAYGRLSILAQWQCSVRLEFAVDSRAFIPPPKVASAVVSLTPRSEPLAPARWTSLETVTKAAFGQRRKMLRSSLKALRIDPAQVGIDPRRRGEELSVAEFCALAALVDPPARHDA
jgi:16S rRNA (adenine1518-N6/adenine1519-N6)-dimethyltransferase